MDVLLELIRKVPLTVVTLLLLIEFLVLGNEVLAHVAVLLLDGTGNLHRVLARDALLTVDQLLPNEFSDVSTGQWNMLDATTNNEAVSDWEDVRHTVTGVNDDTGQVVWLHLREGHRALWAADLTEQSECGLNTNEEALDAERLEHDLGDLLPVLWRIHGRLGEDEPVLLGLAAQVRVHRFVPEFLDAFPVLDLA